MRHYQSQAWLKNAEWAHTESVMQHILANEKGSASDSMILNYGTYKDTYGIDCYRVWLEDDRGVWEIGRTLESAIASLRITHTELKDVKLVIEF